MMKSFTLLFLALGLILSSASMASAHWMSGGIYNLTWNTFDGGGGTSSGGPFSVTGTIGQHDATIMETFNDDKQLAGGFWGSQGLLCFVDFLSFSNLASEWMLAGVAGDVNNDLIVDTGDLEILAEYWLMSCPSTEWDL